MTAPQTCLALTSKQNLTKQLFNGKSDLVSTPDCIDVLSEETYKNKIGDLSFLSRIAAFNEK